MFKLLGYPLIDLGKFLIKLDAKCLGGRATVNETTEYHRGEND